MAAFNNLIVDPFIEMLVEVGRFIPTLVSILFVLVLGMFVAKLLREAMARLFDALKLDKIADKIGVGGILHKGGLKRSPSDIVSSAAYLIVVGIFLLMIAKYIGLSMITVSVDRLLGYVPHVLSAATILVLGMILAKLVSHAVEFVAKCLDLPDSKMIERISRWAILIYVATMALEDLGFGSLLVGTTFHIFFGAVSLAFALAYGLGGQHAAAKHLEKYGKKHA